MPNFRKGGQAALNTRTCPPCMAGDHHECLEQAGIDYAEQSIAWWEWDHTQTPDTRALTYCVCYHTRKDELHPRWEPEFDEESLEHLRSDNPGQTCTSCERTTWDPDEYGKVCAMRQPDSTRCPGTFQPTRTGGS